MFRDRSAGEEPARAGEDGLSRRGRSELAGAMPAAAPPIAATQPRRDPRELLLQAMVETVALRGYDRTTISRVLSVAGLEETVFSEHFRDKHDCFAQAIEALLDTGERATVALIEDAERPWAERVRVGLARLLRALADDPAAARVLLVEMLGAGPEMYERRRAATAALAELMEQGREQSAGASGLPPQTSEAIVGGVLAILHRRALQGELAQLPALCGDLVYFALLPYLEHERAAAIAAG
jgi:AcrR family transcriptional regulator